MVFSKSRTFSLCRQARCKAGEGSVTAKEGADGVQAVMEAVAGAGVDPEVDMKVVHGAARMM